MSHAPHVNGWSCVSGHVELGDSWSSAALHELEEEAVIITTGEHLIPFAAISGPDRIFHYQDDDTQPFTLHLGAAIFYSAINATLKLVFSK